ncbi:MAG: integrase arm-type DNA-binding domain-containing protein [Pseudomonadota bacterium]|uniref:tyrosine-type recombinase/integrase n=1 Tax=Gallaecimonas pentaromativorans TaxID=584787 RepID=UPI00067F29DD|nr:site-specific integrase [Gallaecimonas pentaromativorans]MED5526146.1 integrase arm-type DNA-binding domain-containing protein [Pseudomonadota bacterium]
MGSFTVKEVQAIIREASPGRYADGGGLYLMIRSSGSAYWMLRFTLHGKRRELTLGKAEHLSLASARSEAEMQRKAIREGTDPIAERQRERQIVIRSLNDLFYDWYKDLEKRLKHPRIPQRIYSKEVAPVLGRYPLEKISPMDVRHVIQQVANSDRPTIANDTLMYLKQLFNHAIKLGLLTYNPATAFNVNDAGGIEKSRDRVLSHEELTTVFEAFRQHADSFTRDNYLAAALLLVLGVRKSELIEAKWQEFDLDSGLWTLPDERSKSGKGFVIPLPYPVIKWLAELQVRACGSNYVFPNRRASKTPHMGKDTLNRAISKLFGIEPGKSKKSPNVMGDMQPFTVHDLRRTCRSLLAAEKVPPHVAERCLNHKLQGVEGIYDRYDYLEERKDALNKVANRIEPLVNVPS